MAFADLIRTSTATMEMVATLLESIGSSSYPLTFSSWTPTYGANGSMTFTGVTTTSARYVRIGKLVFFTLDCNGTTGGSANNILTFTLPVPGAGYNGGGCGQIVQTSGKAALLVVSSIGQVSFYDSSNFALVGSTYIRVSGFYEAA